MYVCIYVYVYMNTYIHIYIYASECNVRENSYSEVNNTCTCMSSDKFPSLPIQFCKAKLENNGVKPNNHLSRTVISHIYISGDLVIRILFRYSKFTHAAWWPYCLRRWPEAACLLGSRFRISLWASKLLCCVNVCCAGSSLCDDLTAASKGFYRVCLCVTLKPKNQAA
jgi:hypothetical protein